MTSEPIACSLSAGDAAARARLTADIARRALRERVELPGGSRLVFAREDGVERELHQVIAAESECCSFLQMELGHEEDALVLEITGPPESRPIIGALFA